MSARLQEAYNILGLERKARTLIMNHGAEAKVCYEHAEQGEQYAYDAEDDGNCTVGRH